MHKGLNLKKRSQLYITLEWKESKSCEIIKNRLSNPSGNDKGKVGWLAHAGENMASVAQKLFLLSLSKAALLPLMVSMLTLAFVLSARK